MSKRKLVDEIGHFTTIPNSVVLMTATIGVDALALFAYFRYRGGTSGQIFPAYDDIKTNTGMPRQRIANAIRALEENGLLERRRRFGASTVYILKMPTSISPTYGLMEDEPLVGQSDSISPTYGLSLVRQGDTNKTQLTRINQQDINLPDGKDGKPPQEPSRKKKSPVNQDHLKPSTPETILVFQKLTEVQQSKGRGEVKYFANVEQKTELETAALKLKNVGKLDEALSWALRNERTSRVAMINALVTWAANLDNPKPVYQNGHGDTPLQPERVDFTALRLQGQTL